MYNNSIHLPVTLIVSHSLLSAAKPRDDIRNNRILTYEGCFLFNRVANPKESRLSTHQETQPT